MTIQFQTGHWDISKPVMKKNVLISFVTEADSDMSAIFALNKILFQLSDDNLAKFDVFDVVDVMENN